MSAPTVLAGWLVGRAGDNTVLVQLTDLTNGLNLCIKMAADEALLFAQQLQDQAEHSDAASGESPAA